jgi:hypothetical protein
VGHISPPLDRQHGPHRHTEGPLALQRRYYSDKDGTVNTSVNAMKQIPESLALSNARAVALSAVSDLYSCLLLHLLIDANQQTQPCGTARQSLPPDVLGVCAEFLAADRDFASLVNLNLVSRVVQYVTDPTAKHTIVLQDHPDNKAESISRILKETVKRHVGTEGYQHIR